MLKDLIHHFRVSAVPQPAPFKPLAFEITNRFSCEYGDLNLQKQFNPPADPPFASNLTQSSPPAGTTYNVDVLCSDGVNTDIAQTFTFPAIGGSDVLANIPAGMNCTVSEPTLPAADPNCHWAVRVGPTSSVMITNGQNKNPTGNGSGNAVMVENHYLCTQPPFYDLTVVKTVNEGPAAPDYALTTPPAGSSYQITPI